MADFATHAVLAPKTAGSTSKSIKMLIVDDVGAPKTGLAFDTASLLASYSLDKGARVAITLATATVTGVWGSGKFVEIDATNMPGIYRLDVPDAALASSDSVTIVIWKTGVCYGAVTIPLSATTIATVEAKVDILDTNLDTLMTRVGTPDSGTLCEEVEAVGDAIPEFDVTNHSTVRSDN
jgi:hypothetical protein